MHTFKTFHRYYFHNFFFLGFCCCLILFAFYFLTMCFIYVQCSSFTLHDIWRHFRPRAKQKPFCVKHSTLKVIETFWESNIARKIINCNKKKFMRLSSIHRIGFNWLHTWNASLFDDVDHYGAHLFADIRHCWKSSKLFVAFMFYETTFIISFLHRIELNTFDIHNLLFVVHRVPEYGNTFR